MELVFATHNINKLKEVQLLLPTYIKIWSLEDIGCTEEIAETASTLEGNAELKASYIRERFGFDCFSDDTGLLVDALNGAPGVFSARYAGKQKNATDNIDKLLRELAGKTDRNAHFKTSIALCRKQETILFNGIVQGQITTEKKGKGGFGYDSIFIPNGYDKTFAQLPLTIKNQISHRAQAMGQLLQYLQNLPYATT